MPPPDAGAVPQYSGCKALSPCPAWQPAQFGSVTLLLTIQQSASTVPPCLKQAESSGVAFPCVTWTPVEPPPAGGSPPVGGGIGSGAGSPPVPPAGGPPAPPVGGIGSGAGGFPPVGAGLASFPPGGAGIPEAVTASCRKPPARDAAHADLLGDQRHLWKRSCGIHHAIPVLCCRHTELWYTPGYSGVMVYHGSLGFERISKRCIEYRIPTPPPVPRLPPHHPSPPNTLPHHSTTAPPLPPHTTLPLHNSTPLKHPTTPPPHYPTTLLQPHHPTIPPPYYPTFRDARAYLLGG